MGTADRRGPLGEAVTCRYSVVSADVTHPHGLPPLPYANLRLERQNAAAEVYSGIDQTGAPVTIAVLTAAGAADSAVRGAFVDLAGSNAYTAMAGDVSVHASDLAAARPWAANWQFPGQDGVEQWLSMLPSPAVTGGVPQPVMPAPLASAPQMAAQVAAPPAAQSARSANRSAAAVVIAGGCAVLLIVAIVVVIVVTNGGGEGNRRESPPTTVATSPSTSAGASPSAGPQDPLEGTGKPALKQVSSVSLIGPTYGASEATFTMQYEGWPFAFRTPDTWGCLAGTVQSLPDAKAWVCVNERNSEAKQRVNVMLRRCATTCTSAERADMNTKWFDAGAKPKAGLDDRTWYVETDTAGSYTIDLSRYFGPKAGQPYKWQVGVSVSSPTATREVVQKILNDIISQTP